MAKCRLCGKNPAVDSVCLFRVNPVGELPSVWQCNPECGTNLDSDSLVLLAISGDIDSYIDTTPALDIVDTLDYVSDSIEF
jgi:hypothetical protein